MTSRSVLIVKRAAKIYCLRLEQLRQRRDTSYGWCRSLGLLRSMSLARIRSALSSHQVVPGAVRIQSSYLIRPYRWYSYPSVEIIPTLGVPSISPLSFVIPSSRPRRVCQMSWSRLFSAFSSTSMRFLQNSGKKVGTHYTILKTNVAPSLSMVPLNLQWCQCFGRLLLVFRGL